jgi:hypothetical protein
VSKWVIWSARNSVGLEFFQFVDPPTHYPNTISGTNQKFEYVRAGFFHICVTDPNSEILVQRIIVLIYLEILLK